MANYINKDLKKKTIAVLYQDDEYGKGIFRGLQEGVKKFGGEIVFQKTFSVGEKEFRAPLTEILKLKPDVVATMGLGPSQASIARQGNELGVLTHSQMIASCTADDLNWYNTVGDAGDGVLGVLEFLTGVDTPEMKNFLSGWQRDYQTTTVSHEAGTTYDATRFLLEAVKNSDGTRDSVKKALDELKSYQGIVGPPHQYTKIREAMYPLAISKYDAKKKEYKALKWYTDPEIIDPSRWASYYN